MTTSLAALGFGYCARQLVAADPAAFTVVGTVRDPARLKSLPAGVEGFVFDGLSLSAALADRLSSCAVLLLSAPPDEQGDPVLRLAGPVLAEAAAARRLQQVIYLTTLGVYGDHQGAWVDETTTPRRAGGRLARRLEAEAAWFAFGRTHQVPVAALRLAGIYGPGRNALAQLKAGTAHIIDKPGQVFNRIHVDDISRAVRAVIAQRFEGILNVADDAPTAPGVPVAYAAALMGRPAPVVVPFAEAAKTMSPMALSFWGASKRVSNWRLKTELGVSLAYPTYREGLDALAAAGEGR